MTAVTRLTIYADFNSPLSYLVSVRVDQLVERGRAVVDWRAVEHAPGIPSEGEPVRDDLAIELGREVDEVAGLAGSAIPLPLRLPRVLSNTAAAVGALASAAPGEAPALRRRLFAALWAHGRDIADPPVLAALGSPAVTRPEVVARWRARWLGFDRPVVPLLALPTGIVLRGADILERLDVIAAGGLAERRRRLLQGRGPGPAREVAQSALPLSEMRWST